MAAGKHDLVKASRDPDASPEALDLVPMPIMLRRSRARASFADHALSWITLLHGSPLFIDHKGPGLRSRSTRSFLHAV